MHAHRHRACPAAALVLLGTGVFVSAARAQDAPGVPPAAAKSEVSTWTSSPQFLTPLELAKAAEARYRVGPDVSSPEAGVARPLLAAWPWPAVPKRTSWGTVGPALPPAEVTARLRAKLAQLQREGR